MAKKMHKLEDVVPANLTLVNSSDFAHGAGNGGYVPDAVSFTGETYTARTTKQYGTDLEIDWWLIKRHYENYEGSLAWLHIKEPIAWPYDVFCLGDGKDSGANDNYYGKHFLTHDETKALFSEVIKHYSNKDLAELLGVTRSSVSYWCKGSQRVLKETARKAQKLLNEKCKRAA